MIDNVRRNKYPRYNMHRNTVPDWMGYPGSDYSRYDPKHEEGFYGDSHDIDHLEGAGREGWDYEQNLAYGAVHRPVRSPYGDQSMRRDHRGKGPKNYIRTDQRILEDIVERISREEGVDLSEVEVEVKDGEVLLRGDVKHRYVRHLVEDLADEVPGVRHVENGIRVLAV